MAWGRIDDHADEDTAHLSDKAFRLFWAAIPYCHRRRLGGVMSAQELRLLCRQQGINVRVATELINDATISWSREGENVVIGAWSKYEPQSSAERMQRHRARHRDADVTSHVTRGDVTSRTRTRAGYPEPDPVPVPVTPPVVPPQDEISERDPMVALWLESARGAGHSEGVCYAGIAHIADVVAEALAAGESADRVREAVRRMGAGGWYTERALQRQLRDLVNEANAKPVNPISARIQATLARGSS